MPKVIFDKLTTSGDFAAAARSIATRGTSLKGDVQKALVCGLVHMDTHGDYTSSVVPLLDAIKDAFGKNLHVAATEWVMAYSWLAFNEADKKLFKDQSKSMKIADAKLKLWHTMERAAKAVPFDAQKAVQALFDKFEAQTKAGNGTMSAFLDIVLAQATKVNPDLAVDLFRDLPAAKQNEALATMVAIVTPSNDTVETEEQQQIAA